MYRRVVIAQLLIFAAAAQVRQPSFKANRERGEYYIHRGELKTAIPWLRSAYSIDPANYDNGYDLALACVQTKSLDEARRVIGQLMRRGEKSELHNLLGDVEEASGHMLEAVREYEIAARSDPTEKHVFDLATELLKHQGYEQSLQILEFGVGKYPDSARLRVGLGVAYYSLGRYAEAVESLCKAVDLDQKDTRALEFLGKMRNVSPELTDDVRKRLARFATLYPENAAANYYYALSLVDAEKGNEAEKLLAKAIRLRPEWTEAHFQLGVLYQQKEEPVKAIREYETAVRLQPALRAAHYRLGRLYEAQGEAEKARKQIDIYRSLPSGAK